MYFTNRLTTHVYNLLVIGFKVTGRPLKQVTHFKYLNTCIKLPTSRNFNVFHSFLKTLNSPQKPFLEIGIGRGRRSPGT